MGWDGVEGKLKVHSMEKGVETCSWEKWTIKVSGLLPCEETITIMGDVGERPSRKRPNSRSTTLDG